MRRLIRIACCALLVVAVPFAGAAPNADVALEEQLNERLEGIDSLQANFVQSTSDANNRVLQNNSGRLWVSKPSRFRIETTEPYVQTLVSDGENFWSYDADLEQVIVSALDADIKQVPILLLSGQADRITREYKVSYFRDETVEHYVLAAKSASSLFETLSIEFEADKPVALTVSDSLGQRTRIELHDLEINEPIDASRFQFEAPEGVDVIDDRAAD